MMRAMPSARAPLRPLRRWLARTDPDEARTVVTADGLRLAVFRIRPRGASRGAVILQHGLGSCALGFDYPGRSLARHIAALGFDCFLPELRGHGASEVPRDGRWDLDDHLVHDMPAVLDAARTWSGHERVHWIGHSMGGVLLLLYGILHPDAPIASGQALGAALDYRVGATGFSALVPLRPLASWLRSVPYGKAMHFAAPLLARVADPIVGFNFWLSNVEPEIVRRIYASAFGTISTALLSSLATTFDPRGFCTRDASVHFLEVASRFVVPLRLVAASRDRQVSVEAVRHTARLVGGPVEVVVHGRVRGDLDEYGHWDMLVGRRAMHEVWPGVSAFLDGHA
jgi:alpha-beta hydrolase superfamily lysophospholipase